MKKIIYALSFICMVYVLVAEDPQVTIYNNNPALIRTSKSINLEKGLTEFSIQGVSAKIDPTSVHLVFDNDKKVEILEMNFLYDLVSSSKIFKKYIGNQLVYHLEDGTELQGKLLSYSGGDLILEEPDGEIRITSSRHIRDYKFPKLPGGLITVPTLQWQINSDIKGQHDAELSYLTDGIDWHAEYVLVLAQNESDFNLSSWISLNNQSGASYKNAKVKLIAGDLHRAPQPEAPRVMLARQAKDQEVQRREIFDYHLYEISRKVDIADKEIKQISLFDNIEARAEKKYIFENSAYRSESEAALSIKLFIPNTKDNNLGIPLPKGKVRMFKEDKDGSLQMIGEDRIPHTGKEDLIELTAGKAFDVKGKRTILNREEYRHEEVIEVRIELFNRTDHSANVEVCEKHRGDWHVKSSDADYEKKSNSLLSFPVTLQGNTEKTIKYEFVREF
ncbi:MAG: hypothetical protein K9M80_02145 [Candidatus Marinimicrobia bacterium]|nr:hypothetical protein [Candidatus Neomarinimicrobiota bacterium]